MGLSSATRNRTSDAAPMLVNKLLKTQRNLSNVIHWIKVNSDVTSTWTSNTINGILETPILFQVLDWICLKPRIPSYIYLDLLLWNFLKMICAFVFCRQMESRSDRNIPQRTPVCHLVAAEGTKVAAVAKGQKQKTKRGETDVLLCWASTLQILFSSSSFFFFFARAVMDDLCSLFEGRIRHTMTKKCLWCLC